MILTGWDAADAQKRARLQRMRTIATTLLGVMAIVFALSAHFKPEFAWLAWIEAFSEAALIGGLADWFAVVALFRHPGGIPFPHTAIVATNKDRIGAQLGVFVEENFLTPSNIASRLRELDLAGHLLRWLSVTENTRTLFATFRTLTPRLVDAVDDAEIERVIRRVIVEEIERLDLAHTGADLLAIVTADALHQRLLERLLPVLAQFLSGQRPEIKRRFAKQSVFTPGWFDAMMVNRFVDGMVDLMEEIASTPDHPMRVAFDGYVRALTTRLREDPDLAIKAEQVKTAIVTGSHIDELVTIGWNTIKARLVRLPSAPAAPQEARFSAIAARIAQELVAEPAIVARMNDKICDVVETVLGQFRQQFSRLITEIVQRWDAAMVTDKIELEIGPDLQFVRLNGSIVGGCAGLVLHAALIAAGAA
jgi:uncharacterized membrane-anchored protein YjiN (DUF445 family)